MSYLFSLPAEKPFDLELQFETNNISLLILKLSICYFQFIFFSLCKLLFFMISFSVYLRFNRLYLP